jgi:hypothetical protein
MAQIRRLWAAVLINSIPDIPIAWIASTYFDSGLGGFLGVYFGFQVIYFALWLKRFSWGWFIFWLWGRRKMADYIENALSQQRFPAPPEFIGDVDSYLSGIADDSMLSPRIRVKAAADLGALTGIRSAGNSLYALQLTLAFETALQNYSRRFPLRGADDAPMSPDYQNARS